MRGLAKGLDCSGVVASPTFTLSREYDCRNGLKLHHFDFYRLSTAGLVADQLAESLENPKHIVVVEWSNIVDKVLPADRLTVEFKPVETDSKQRQIIFDYHDSQAGMVRQLETVRQKGRP